jgi:hypothetical protein
MSDFVFTNEEGTNAVAFLDRVQLNGHKERIAMNAVVARIVQNMDPQRPVVEPTNPADDATNQEGPGDAASGD